MEEGQIIYQGKSKQGRDFLIRYPKFEDTENMLTYINALSSEQTYVLMQGEPKTIEDEKEFLTKSLKNIKEHKGIVLLACAGDLIIGITNLEMQTGVASHVGDIGVSIAKEYRGEGIGSLLMDVLLNEAEANIPQLKIVTLGVYEDNEPALDMYKKLGFQEFGRLPQGLRRKEKYSDHLYMYKKVR